MHVDVNMAHERPFLVETSVETPMTSMLPRRHVMTLQVARDTVSLVLDLDQLVEIRDELSRHIEEQHRQNGRAAAGSAATAGVGTYRDGTPLPF